MCDRIVVMHQGRITGELTREEFTEERILTYAAGLALSAEQPTAATATEEHP
jgi:ABC-type dipeptide/oligopeptide/nickel transport system ATPase component